MPSSYYVFSQVLQGIQAEAEANRVQLRLVANAPDDQQVARLYLTDPKLRPDGMLIFGARRTEPLLLDAFTQKIPCVALGRQVDRYNISGLGRDEEHYGWLAASYLLDLGHRAIAFVGGDADFDYVRNRLKGYRTAMRQRGVTVAPQWVQPGDGNPATLKLVREAPEITAVMFVNDQHAAGGLAMLQVRRKIPQELSVLSFDNTDIARNAKPPLTSISYHFFEEGQWAVKMLLDHIRNPALERVHTYFKGELIERRVVCAAEGMRKHTPPPTPPRFQGGESARTQLLLNITGD